jgi:hypothetical protein
MSLSSFATRAALAASLVLAGGALTTSAHAQKFGGHGFGGAGIGHGFGGAGFSRGFAGAGFARPAFGGRFAHTAWGPGFARSGLITGRSVGFGPRAVFGPRFAFRHHRFARRGFGFPLALAGLGFGLAAYDYGYPYDYCYLRRSWWGGYPHLVKVCPVW